MSLWEAALLGVVQGLTEFLPISSTAHLLAIRQALHHPTPDDAFTTAVQLGTLVAVLGYFRRDIAALTWAVGRDLATFRLGTSADSRLAWLIVVGTVPVVVVGGLAKRWLKDTFYNLPAMATAAVVFALLMAAAEWWARRTSSPGRERREVSDIGWRTAVWVGGWQALALVPGASRSGTTITAGLFAGLTRPAAARFSFLLSLPSVFAAGVKDLYDEYKLYRVSGGSAGLFASGDEVLALGVGVAAAAVVGYLAIWWLLGFLARYSTGVFVAYRLLLGGAILALLAAGVLK